MEEMRSIAIELRAPFEAADGELEHVFGRTQIANLTHTLFDRLNAEVGPVQVAQFQQIDSDWGLIDG